MQYQPSTTNNYVNAAAVEDTITAQLKANERVMITGYMDAAMTDILQKRTKLSKILADDKADMVKLATRTLTADLDGGLMGKAADAAKDYLRDTVAKPKLHNPIKKN